MKVTTLGIPLTCGGANTELGHTILLWRQRGIEVTVAEVAACSCGKPTARWEPENTWKARLEDAGCKFMEVSDDTLGELEGRLLVAMCHSHACHLWPRLAKTGCRLIWSPCMCYMMPHEREAFSECPPTAVHFQSDFQRSMAWDQYDKLFCNHHAVIHGAAARLPFAPRPHGSREPFVVGRLARPCRTKWSPKLWDHIKHPRGEGRDVRALCMGWDDELAMHCGEPPEWAECLPQDAISTRDFLNRCHALICPNWGLPENWPRVGLEAMSAGVPLLVDNYGGWTEMLHDGETGLLCEDHEFGPAISWLSDDEDARLSLADAGRRSVLELTDPDVLGAAWEELLESV